MSLVNVLMNHTDILSEIQQYNVLQEHIDLCQGLGIFVNLICANRDPSHGYEHMKQVARNSLKIFNQLEKKTLVNMDTNQFISLLLTVSWLHDVADRKYDVDGNLKKQLDTFVRRIYNNDLAELVLNTIPRTSYSFEVNIIQTTGELDWLSVLGYDGCLLRDIVSDADKIEAIGRIGIVRCMTYNIELFKKANDYNPTFDELVPQVKRHAAEKLLKLTGSYIRTEPGKLIAAPLHFEMSQILENNDELDKIFGEIKY